jgi:hypothetical protein
VSASRQGGSCGLRADGPGWGTRDNRTAARAIGRFALRSINVQNAPERRGKPQDARFRGCSSVVEHHLAKVRVAGSSPVIRSERRSRRYSAERAPQVVGWPSRGGLAEWRGSGLQSRIHGFESRTHLVCAAWAIGAAVARFPDTEEVTGSIPVSPTIDEGLDRTVQAFVVSQQPGPARALGEGAAWRGDRCCRTCARSGLNLARIDTQYPGDLVHQAVHGLMLIARMTRSGLSVGTCRSELPYRMPRSQRTCRWIGDHLDQLARTARWFQAFSLLRIPKFILRAVPQIAAAGAYVVREAQRLAVEVESHLVDLNLERSL